MKRLLLFLGVPTYLWALDYGAERYYQLSDYVAYELKQCPVLVVDYSPVSADRYAQAPPYDQSGVFVHQQPRQGAVSNGTIGGGIFVVGFALIQCMDWWIKRNRRIEQFLATYEAWTCDDYQRLFEGSPPGRTYNFDTDRYEPIRSWHLPDDKIFTLYHHYQFRGFRDYLKTRAGYEREILNLAAALGRKDKIVRKSIKHMPGCSMKIFTALINDMASDIEHARIVRAQQEEKEKTLKAKRVFVQHIMRVLKGELMDTLIEPYTWRAIGTLTKYIASEVTRARETENAQGIALLDGCCTCTAS